MVRTIVRSLLALDLEEKILNSGTILAIICIFFPWLGGQWLGGETVSYTALGFYTSVIGLAVLLLHIFVLLITLIPLTGGPVLVRRKQKDLVRLLNSAIAVILTLAIWSVLTKFTFEFSRIEIHFGLYGTLIGGLIATLYSYLRFQDQRKSTVQEFFTQQDRIDEDLQVRKTTTHRVSKHSPSEPEELRTHRNTFHHNL